MAFAALPGTFRVGPLRFPIFGVFATAGLLSALALSQRTAKRAGVPSQKLWDAGVVGIVAAFVVSRALLVAENFRVFRLVPVLVLSLPSLTYTGMLLTAVLVWIYLRWKGVPALRAMDAWAPCAALLWAFLELGHFFEGTDGGMPTAMPWGVVAPGDSVLGRTQPVQVFGVVLALGLVPLLWARIGRRVGEAVGFGFFVGGLLSFALGFLRQPVVSELPLDPAQIVAALCALAGGILMIALPSGDSAMATESPGAKARILDVR